MHFSSKKAYKNTPVGFLPFAICGKIVPEMRACLANTPKKKWKNEKRGREGREENEVELRVRQSNAEPTRSRRREEAVPAPLPSLWPMCHGAEEQPTGPFNQNPPRYFGGYRARCADPAID